VWSLASTPRAARALTEQADALPDLRRPHVITGTPGRLGEELSAKGHGDVRFDVAVGRNTLTQEPDKQTLLKEIREVLSDGGVLCLAEVVPRHTQRLYDLIDWERETDDLRARVVEAEEAIYDASDNPMTNWDEDSLRDVAGRAGFAAIEVSTRQVTSQQIIGQALLERWFGSEEIDGRITYAGHLRERLSDGEMSRVAAVYRSQLLNRMVSWSSTLVRLFARRP
jgi:putative ATPase